MANEQTITLTIILPSSDEAVALAQLVKRIGYEDVKRFTNKHVTYGGRSEADMAWMAVCALQRQLADAGFEPR